MYYKERNKTLAFFLFICFFDEILYRPCTILQINPRADCKHVVCFFSCTTYAVCASALLRVDGY